MTFPNYLPVTEMFEGINWNAMLVVLLDILKYALFGAEASLVGYLKSENLPNGWKAIFTKEFWTCFSLPKALKTVILGAVLGAFTRGQIYLPIETLSSPDYIAFANFFNLAVVFGTENLIKLVMRRTPLMKGWDYIKEKALRLIEAIYS